MLKPKLRDELEMVFQSIEHLQTLSKHLSHRLQQAMVQLEPEEEETLQRVPLTDDQVSQLLRLNRRLSTIETFSKTFCSELMRDIEHHIADPAQLFSRTEPTTATKESSMLNDTICRTDQQNEGFH